jgi:glycosyltransferase involved in cell wall biosynthesis
MFHPECNGSEFRQAHGLEDDFIVLYAGAHGVSNDLGVLLEAAAQIEQPEIRMVLVGDGKEKAHLQAQAAALGLKNVLFLPPVPKQDMAEVLAAADASVAILKPLEMYKTTYPNKVFDTMAAGRPVILAIDGVIRTIVEESGAGIYVPPGDAQRMAEAIRFLAANPEQARAMGRAGRVAVEQRFERARLAEQLALIMEEMVQHRR